MTHRIELFDDHDGIFSQGMSDSEIVSELCAYLMGNPDVEPWHANLNIQAAPYAIIHGEMPMGDQNLVFASLGFDFDNADHALMFKLTFGGAA